MIYFLIVWGRCNPTASALAIARVCDIDSAVAHWRSRCYATAFIMHTESKESILVAIV